MGNSIDDEMAVSIRNLTVKYDGNIALENINFDVERNDFLGIIGPNGGGKTTLLKTIIGIVQATSGETLIFGKKNRRKEKIIGYVPQISTIERSFPVKVKEVVLSGMLNGPLSLFHKYSDENIEKSRQFMRTAGIENLAERNVSDLSGGEFQKMLLARALAVEPKILILDEPTASVDSESSRHIFSLLKELNSSMTVITVSHNMEEVAACAKKVAYVDRELKYYGATENFKLRDTIEEGRTEGGHRHND